MKSILKIIIIFCLLNILVMCDRNELYNFADEKINIIYAIADDGTNVLVIKATENYYNEYTASGLSIATIPDLLHITDEGSFLAAQSGSTIAYYSDKIENGKFIWNYYNSAYLIYGLASRNGNRYVLTNTWNDCIYRYGSGNLESINLSLLSSTYVPVLISKSGSKIYIYGKSGGTASVFDFDNPSVPLGLNTGPGEPAYYLASLNNELYLGTSNYIYSKSAGALNATSLGGFAKSYAIVDSGIFVGTMNGATMQIKMLGSTDFTVKQTMSSSAGSIILKAYTGNVIAVGINSATPAVNNGLYLYYPEFNLLLKISSRPVYAIAIK